MVTTEADNSFIERALDYGADEFLMKPFSTQSLREKLRLMGFEVTAEGRLPRDGKTPTEILAMPE